MHAKRQAGIRCDSHKALADVRIIDPEVQEPISTFIGFEFCLEHAYYKNSILKLQNLILSK